MKNLSDELANQARWVPLKNEASFAAELDLDYQALIKRFKRNWLWFVLAVITGLTGAGLYLRYAVPIYSANSAMLVEESPGGGLGYTKNDIAEGLGFENTYVIENELYVLKSPRLMERVVRLLGLDVSYFHLGDIRDTPS